jgi:hypothetical protein
MLEKSGYRKVRPGGRELKGKLPNTPFPGNDRLESVKQCWSSELGRFGCALSAFAGRLLVQRIPFTHAESATLGPDSILGERPDYVILTINAKAVATASSFR